MARKSGSGIPAGGEGWGGEAKGAGKGGPAKAFTPDHITKQTIPGGKGDPVKMALRQSQREIDIQRAQELKDHLFKLATSATFEATQVQASKEWLNRHEGMPIARSISLNTDDVRDLTDAELAAELARYGGTPVESGARNETPASTPRLPDVLH